MRYLLYIISTSLFANSALPVLMEHPYTNKNNKDSIILGGIAFKERCVSCHALNLAGYDPVLKGIGLTKDLMPKHDITAWQGHPPPDLSLVARTRGINWIYTYFHSFYHDPQNPKGYNNLILPNSSMPAVLSDLHGTYILDIKNPDIYGIPHEDHWFTYLKQESPGSMDLEHFSNYISDLVNFLDYVSEPYRLEREQLGWKVLLYLLAFAVVARMLYHSYWKKINNKK